jgi:HD-like signal output (HDOD) protein
MYQYGSAQVCAYICEFMEIPIFMPQAYWAGMLHEVGKLALVRLHPESLRAALKLARTRDISLDHAMHLLMQCSHREVGEHLVRRYRLPQAYASVMRYCGTPEEAKDDQELVAVVTFATQLCRRHGIGANGDPPVSRDLPLNELPGWSILRNRVFPSFDLVRFESQFTRWAVELRAQLMGNASAVVD